MGLHPSLQAANDLWDNLLEVDENNDNKIEFSEFKQFVLYRDEELWKIFKQIDGKFISISNREKFKVKPLYNYNQDSYKIIIQLL